MANKKIYIVGGGIAGLATAAYLIRDGKIEGKNITILDLEKEMNGGSLDAKKVEDGSVGYVMRGHRVLEEKSYSALLDLFSFIPTLDNSQKTVFDVIFEFNKKIKPYEKARLVENKKIIDGVVFRFSLRDKLDFLKLAFRSEKSLGTLQIQDYFRSSFFQTNFWFEYCTVFAFQPWHSLVEFRRYMLRTIHAMSYLETLSCVWATPYNQYETIVLPLLKWLKEHGVDFESSCMVTDLNFVMKEGETVVHEILYSKEQEEKKIKVSDEDLVFVTNGSMTMDSIVGGMNKVPKMQKVLPKAGWILWENIAHKNVEFGRPEVFNSRVHESKWESFTLTFRDKLFFDLMEQFTKNKAGKGVGTTFKSSNWLLTIILPHQPHFKKQPKNITVCWGYALSVDKEGNHIKKKMSECTGEEILRELCFHLGFEKEMEEIVKSAVCIPCMLPYTTSQFLTRSVGDRPAIIPKKTKNLAFIGQFCEQPKDFVFTDEYSVRSAQIAVFSLLNLKKKVSPIYRGYRNPMVLFRLVRAIFGFGK